MDRILGWLVRFFVWRAAFTERLAGHGIGRFEKWKPGEKLKLLLVGYNGAGNTGSDARVIAIADQLREAFGEDRIHLTVMTLDRESLAGCFHEDVDLYEFTTAFPAALYRACSVNHAAVICEGSALKSTFADALTMFYCEAAGVMRSQGKPCAAYGTEAGQMDPLLKSMVSDLFRGTFILARTEESLEVLKELGLEGHSGTDTAWDYSGAVDDRTAREWLRSEGWDGKAPCIGAAVIDPFCWPVHASLSRWIRGKLTGHMDGCYDKWYFFSASEERARARDQYLADVASAVSRFQRETGSFVVVIGMEKLDGEACRALVEKLDGSCGSCALLLSGDHPASLITGVLRQLSFLVTSRYHAAVLSMERAVPFTAVSMDERLDSLMKELGLEQDLLHHTADPDLEQEIYASLKALSADRDRIRGILSEKQSENLEKLRQMRSALKEYICGALAAGSPGKD